MKNYSKTGRNGWSIDRARAWYEKHDWLCGFNYVPAYAGNTTEFWQAEDFDADRIGHELEWAADWGYNTARVFLQYLVWKDDACAYKERIDVFLDIAARNGISTMPVIFDDCSAYKGEFLHRWVLDGVGIAETNETRKAQLSQWRQPHLGRQPEPVPGVHNSVWTPCPGSSIADDPLQYASLAEYEKDIISSFSSDPRVLMWDLCNEPHNASRRERSIPLVRDSFAWAREVDPEQQHRGSLALSQREKDWVLPVGTGYGKDPDSFCVDDPERHPGTRSVVSRRDSARRNAIRRE